MIARAFLDTNVLVYAFDRDESSKRKVALALLADARAATHVVSPQVLQEFFNATTRKLKRPLPAADAEEAVRAFARLTVVPATADLVLAAVGRHRRDGISIWDALVVESAITGGCARLLTEDLQDGRAFGSVRVENPFAA
jgi:predicted nucleic acid-binding protein